MKYIKTALMLAVAFILFCSCSLNNINISGEKTVVAIGIDFADDKYKVSTVVFSANVPNDFSSKENFEYSEAQTETLIQAFNEINKQNLNNLFFKQNKVLILGEGIDQDIMFNTVEYLVQNKYVNANTNVFNAKKAFEVLKSEQGEALNIEDFNKMLSTRAKSVNFEYPVYSLLNSIETKSEMLFLPFIEVEEQDSQQPDNRVKIECLAFYKNFEFVETLEEKQNKAVLVANNRLTGLEFTDVLDGKQNEIFLKDIKCEVLPDYYNKNISISVQAFAKTAIGVLAVSKTEQQQVENLSKRYIEQMILTYFDFLISNDIKDEGNMKFFLNLIDQNKYNELTMKEIVKGGNVNTNVSVSYY